MPQFNGFICSVNTYALTTLEGTQGRTKTDKEEITFSFENGVATFKPTESALLQLSAIEALFSLELELTELTVSGLNDFIYKKTGIKDVMPRTVFYQLPFLWHHSSQYESLPEVWIKTKEVDHPVRPKVIPGQVLYARVCPRVGKKLSFRVAEVERDLDMFHNWQNQPRVANFWELAKPKEELREYLQKGLQDPHQFPVIYEVDDEPAGYFEFYWVKEDRLGPYYDSDAFDRSFHILVGNKRNLGFQNTDSMLKSATHCLLLEEPRTRRVMAEPRHDNVAILRYIQTFRAWKKLKEFDFPHKRAALLECKRENFFRGSYL